MRDRLVRDLERGHRVLSARPAALAVVASIGEAPAEAPEGHVEVRIRFLDGERAGQVDAVTLHPLNRVRLPDA